MIGPFLRGSSDALLEQSSRMSMSQAQTKVIMSLGKAIGGVVITAIKDWIKEMWNEIQTWMWETVIKVIREIVDIFD